MPARKRFAKVHMRCTKERCKARFKGIDNCEAKCPVCGARAKPDVWAAKKEWNLKLCNCSAYSWSGRNSPHRLGGGACYYNPRNPQPEQFDMPATPGEYPF